jgi:hypothetical protein
MRLPLMPGRHFMINESALQAAKHAPSPLHRRIGRCHIDLSAATPPRHSMTRIPTRPRVLCFSYRKSNAKIISHSKQTIQLMENKIAHSGKSNSNK